MTNSALNQLFEKFNRMRVLVIGDAMIDTYVWGKADRISPEAPVPIISVKKRENRLGGAANVARNIVALGATPILYSVIGNDESGTIFKNLLEKREISSQGIFEDQNRQTTVKNRIISDGKQIARLDEESTAYISSELENSITDSLTNEINTNKIDVIIFVDYNKGVLTPKLFETINSLAQKQGIPTAVDPKKKNFNIYKNVTLFKPNFKEFVEGTNQSIDNGNLKALTNAAQTFSKNQKLKYLLITLSELGCLINSDHTEQYFPVAIRHITDVSGAGDTVISTASLAMAAGMPPKIIARISNLAGGLVCEKLGVVPIDREQLKKEMEIQKIY